MLDAEALAEAHAGMVREYVERMLAPVLDQLKAMAEALGAIVKRVDAVECGAAGPDFRQIVDEAVTEAVAALPAIEPVPSEVEGPDMAAIGEMVERSVAAHVAELPAPKDGASVTLDDVRPLIAEGLAAAVAALPAPENGKDADPALVKAMVDEAVTEAVAALPAIEAPAPIEPDMAAIAEDIAGLVREAVALIPAPKDAPSLEELAPLVEHAVGERVAALPVPKDGVGVADALIDRKGALVLTLSDGRVRELGEVVGKDADQRALEDLVKRLVDAIPRPRDGMDGLGFDDMSVEHDGGRCFTLRFARGEIVKEFGFKLPVVLDAGVWKEGRTYEAGDGTTWAGSYWVAQKETTAKPDAGDGSWRLAVKKGRDAKPAEPVSIQPPKPTPQG